jgi:LuxR family maltose regulon positive regulatory protein
MMFTGRVNILRNWLAALPETSLHTHPRLTIYRVWIDLLQGESDLSEQALQEKENLLRALPPSPENDQLRVELMVVLCRFVALSGNTARAIRFAQEALGYLPQEDLASRARVNSALAIAYGLEGNFEQAERAYHECLRQAQAAGYYSLAAHTTLVMATGLIDYGRLREAARYLQSIIDMGVQSGQKVFYPAGQGYIGLAGIHLEWNDLETAEDCLKQGMELCSQGGLAGASTGYAIKSRLRQAKGDLEGALEEVHLLEQAFQRTGPLTMLSVTARQIQIRLAMGDDDGVSRWAMPLMNMLSGDPATAGLPMLALESVQAIIVRVFLAQEEIERAMQLLDKLQATAEPGRRFGRLIEVYLLRALALQKQNRENIALEALKQFEHALDLAEPEGYILLFLEEGPTVLPLLNAVANHPAAPDRTKKYARKLLDAFAGGKPVASPVSEAAASEETIELLSRRELEVLRLMAEGLTYAEIAQRLVLSLNTVRFHVKGLYGKLGVGKRAAAIDRARALGLL